MKLVTLPTDSDRPAPRVPELYFAHIPKTAGMTMKAFFENNVPRGSSLVLEEEAASLVSRDTLQRHTFISSHYSYEILRTLGARPTQIAMLIREPVSRFKSWLAHGRRSTHADYHAACMLGNAVEVLHGPESYSARQAHWLARTFQHGPEYKAVPPRESLPGLVDQIDIPGVVEELDRFMQLVAYRMGWRAPELGWRVNQRPASDKTPTIESAAEEAEVRRLLEIDEYFYALMTARFWAAYADMLSQIHPDGQQLTTDEAARTPVRIVQAWLQRHHDRQVLAQCATPATSIDLTGELPVSGDGWWWREGGASTSYRWSGPDMDATLDLPPLASGHYALSLDFVGVSSWKAWEGVHVTFNGRNIPVVHERFTPRRADAVMHRLYANLGPEDIADGDLTRIRLHVPQTHQPYAEMLRVDSQDTQNYDTRELGIALRGVRVRAVPPPARPTLSLRRPQSVA